MPFAPVSDPSVVGEDQGADGCRIDAPASDMDGSDQGSIVAEQAYGFGPAGEINVLGVHENGFIHPPHPFEVLARKKHQRSAHPTHAMQILLHAVLSRAPFRLQPASRG